MNIGQIATAVGQRLGVATGDGTTRDGAAVRSSLQMRHDQLYRSFLWRDSLIEMEIAINSPYAPNSNYMPTKGRVILPSIFQHVVGARMGWRSLDIQRAMLYYRADYGRFMSSGYAAEFVILSSAVWEFDTPQNLTLQAANAADNNSVLTLDELQTDGVSLVRSAFPVTTAGIAAGTTDRIDTLLNAATNPANQPLAGNMLLNVAGTNIVTISPTSASAPRCQRLQLVGNPKNTDQNACNLHILGKRVTPTFSADTDVPGINGLDGVLAALACYDYRLYRDEGGIADATPAIVEAVGPEFLTSGKPGGFLAKLIEEEVIQAAYNCRIIPEYGYGGDNYFDQPYYSKGNVYG